MAMQTVKEIVSLKSNPGENYLKDLQTLHRVLTPMDEDDRRAVIVAMVELGYRVKSPRAIADVVTFLLESFSIDEQKRNEMYGELTQTLFGGQNNG